MSLHFLCKSAFYHHFRWVSYRLFCAKSHCFRIRSQSSLNISFYCIPFASRYSRRQREAVLLSQARWSGSEAAKMEQVDDAYLSGSLVSSLLGLASLYVVIGNPLLMTSCHIGPYPNVWKFLYLFTLPSKVSLPAITLTLPRVFEHRKRPLPLSLAPLPASVAYRKTLWPWECDPSSKTCQWARVHWTWTCNL